jgi:transcriptional regulator CtsR
VRAYNATGNSNYSNEAYATTADVAPSAPSGLTAIASSSTQINLSWTDASNNETGFKIERKTGLGGTYSQVTTVGPNVSSYADSGLTSRVTYYYRLRAYNSIGNSDYSNEANATTFDTTPSAPSGLGAEAISSSQINLSWQDNSDNETGFKIERKTGLGGAYSQIATVAAGVTTYANTGLVSNTTYFYRIHAYNAIGNSNYSNEANATTADTVPNTPTALSAEPVATTQINLSWTDASNNEAGFKIERSLDGVAFSEIGQLDANITRYSNTGLTKSTTYYYRVYAFNRLGNSDYSNTVNATTLTVDTPKINNVQSTLRETGKGKIIGQNLGTGGESTTTISIATGNITRTAKIISQKQDEIEFEFPEELMAAAKVRGLAPIQMRIQAIIGGRSSNIVEEEL